MKTIMALLLLTITILPTASYATLVCKGRGETVTLSGANDTGAMRAAFMRDGYKCRVQSVQTLEAAPGR